MMQSPSGGMGDGYGGAGGGMGEQPIEEQPWYVKYGLRALGTAAGGLAIFFGLFSVLFSIFSPTCIVFSVWQIFLGFLVVTIESPCCVFCVEHVHKVTEIVERKPLWMKAAAYVIAPLPAIIFCFGANTFLGSGAICATGVVYGMVALGKKADRAEMARNAQTVFPNVLSKNSSNPYQPQVNTTQPNSQYPPPTSSSKLTSPSGTHGATSPTSPSGMTGYVDPIQASAAQWAAQTQTATFEPPPTYNQSQNHGRPAGWDQSFADPQQQQQQPRGGGGDPFANPFQ